MPQLADPNFSRAVVLMIEHGEQGSFGLVINHPSPIRASELLDSLDMSWRGEDSAVVWAGGPVSRHRLCCTSRSARGANSGGTIEVPVDDLTIDVTGSAARSQSTAAQRAPVAQLLRLGPRSARRRDAAAAWLHRGGSEARVRDASRSDVGAACSLGINPGDLFVGRGVN